MSNVSQRTVLLVDDTEVNQHLIRAILEKLGFAVVVASHGEAAIVATRTQSFDAVLMDIQMPVMDGFAATSLLREQGFSAPIIALTAENEPTDFAERGFNAVITKPFTRHDFEVTLKGVLEEDWPLIFL